MIDQSGADLNRHLDGSAGPLALDIGGADVNGTARRWFPEITTWFGLDIAPGPGVDIVADATTWRGGWAAEVRAPGLLWALPAFDIVLCTELLEHVKDWPAVLETIHAALVPGGHAFITCASTGRRPHGARGELDPPAGEHYANVNPDEMRDKLSRMYVDGLKFDAGLRYNPNPGDLYVWLRKEA
jgi:SAM-dependent methyltransferase